MELLLRGLMENNRVHLQNTEHTAILPKVGPAACHSEANEEARLVERKVCFIPEADRERVDSSKGQLSIENQGARDLKWNFRSM